MTPTFFAAIVISASASADDADVAVDVDVVANCPGLDSPSRESALASATRQF